MTDQLNGKFTSVFDAEILNLNKINLENGALTVLNSKIDIPFNIKRVYYLYDVPNKTDRGGHGHKNLTQLIVAASGSFEIELNDGKNSRTLILRQPDEGLFIPPGLWRDLRNFSGGGVCLVLANEVYDEKDYIRDFKQFKIFKNDNCNSRKE